MPWFDYLLLFLAGMFLTNTVPHFVHGVSGNKFPSPFATPPGRGLSSPFLNVLWALFNLAIGGVLLAFGSAAGMNLFAWIIGFAGVAFMSIYLSFRFASKHQE